MNSMLWGFPNPNSLQGLCRLQCAEFTRIYPSWQTSQHVIKDRGWKMFCGFLTLMFGEKYCGQVCNCVNLQKRSVILLLFVLHCCILGSVFDSTLPYFTTHPLPVSSFLRARVCWECAHAHVYADMMECLWYAYMSLPMHLCTYVSVYACVSVCLTFHSSLWILMQRSRPRYGCKS